MKKSEKKYILVHFFLAALIGHFDFNNLRATRLDDIKHPSLRRSGFDHNIGGRDDATRSVFDTRRIGIGRRSGAAKQHNGVAVADERREYHQADDDDFHRGCRTCGWGQRRRE